MRRLGDELGVEAMSLYGHVRNKAALLDGIHDALLGEMHPKLRGRDWASDIRTLARAFRELLRAHPNALPMFASRAAAGAQGLRHVEAGLTILEAAGLSPADALATFQSVFAFVVGHALYTFGHTGETESIDYATLPDSMPRVRALAKLLPRRNLDAEFELGLDTFIAGLKAKRPKTR